MVLRHVSILRDHPQGVCLQWDKDGYYTFKIVKMIS